MHSTDGSSPSTAVPLGSRAVPSTVGNGWDDRWVWPTSHIAGTAKSNDLSLVTLNTRDFGEIDLPVAAPY